MGYKLEWERYDLKNDISFMESKFETDLPQIIGFDTETDGLDTIKSKPFLIIVSWKIASADKGVVFTFKYTPDLMNRVFPLMLRCKYIIGHNTKYDLHMLRNGGSPFPINKLNDNCRLTDNMILARLVADTDEPKSTKHALKSLAVKYIDSTANTMEKEIKAKWNTIKTKHRAILAAALPKPWSPASIKAFLHNNNLIFDLPTEIREIYTNWLEQVGEGTYYDIYKEDEYNMINYAFNDGIFTLEVFLKLYALLSLEPDSIIEVFKLENKLIPIYYEQEGHGFTIDTFYLNSSKDKLKAYIKDCESELHNRLGQKLSAGQHAKLIDVLITKFNVPVHYFEPSPNDTESKEGSRKLGKFVLEKLISIGGEVQRIAELLLVLRTATKWLPTYVMGVLKAVLYSPDFKYHPQSLSTGTVTGRISGTMQQMPRNPLLHEKTGEELFNPRKMIIPSGGGYDTLVLQDFDQMELRVQAHYTMIASSPDENLFKLFVPYNKVNSLTGQRYRLDNAEDRAKINDQLPTGGSIWVNPQDYGDQWVPSDPHGMHVRTAFGLTPESPEWKDLRNAAKTINFAINYGGGLKMLLSSPALEAYSNETITKIFEAYNHNFKGIIHYKNWVNTLVKRDGQMTSVYGRIYKVREAARFSYKVGNYLIQGSAADLVKNALVLIDDFLKKHNLKSRILYTVHDEIIWELYNGEEFVIKELDMLLNKAGDWCLVPLTCGTEISKTNWAEKKEYKGEL